MILQFLLSYFEKSDSPCCDSVRRLCVYIDSIFQPGIMDSFHEETTAEEVLDKLGRFAEGKTCMYLFLQMPIDTQD